MFGVVVPALALTYLVFAYLACDAEFALVKDALRANGFGTVRICHGGEAPVAHARLHRQERERIT